MKYYVLLPAISQVGGSLDNMQWESILRSVSAHRSYRWVYDGEYRAANIADFLILNGQMPRSLAYSYEKIVSNLGYIARGYGERHAAHDTAESIRATLAGMSIDRIMDQGLHEFLGQFHLPQQPAGGRDYRGLPLLQMTAKGRRGRRPFCADDHGLIRQRKDHDAAEDHPHHRIHL